MANKSITIALIIAVTLTPLVVHSSDKSTTMWKWWDKSQDKRRVEQQQEVIAEIKVSACQEDIDRWNEKLVAEPDSLYYQYKREQATKACMVDDNDVLLPF